MVFSGSNIEVFTVRNKVFVVSFFRNIAFRKILSAKALKLIGFFWNISPSVTNLTYSCTPSKEKVLILCKNQGLHFFFIASIIKKRTKQRIVFRLVFLVSCFYFYVFCSSPQKKPFMSTERFDIRHAPAPWESFRLLYISKSKFGGDWSSSAHTHSCTELFYCLSGEGQFYLSGQLYPVKPDDMITSIRR